MEEVNIVMSIFIQILEILFSILGTVVPLLIAVAYMTLVERKILGSVQRRLGPDQVGVMGLLQPISDAAKLIFKETVLPSVSDKFLFIVAPILSFLLSLMAWAVVPFGINGPIADIDLGVLYIFGISSLGVYSIIIAGWSSSSRYAFLGALRSAAQMISYEVSFGLILVSILLSCGTLNLTEIVLFQDETVWFVIPFFPLSIIFFISTLAETNRPPFDLPEAEAELVAGYNVEYSSIGFALFFISEYLNIILMSTLNVIFFWGGWSVPFQSFLFWFPPSVCFTLKILVFLFLFIWIRAILPRYRYDQLMHLGWKVFLPTSLAYVILVSAIMII
jgi:NADH-quinone oxidoreductase subunit H